LKQSTCGIGGGVSAVAMPCLSSGIDELAALLLFFGGVLSKKRKMINWQQCFMVAGF